MQLMKELYENPTNTQKHLTILEYLFAKATQDRKEISKAQKLILAHCVNYTS